VATNLAEAFTEALQDAGLTTWDLWLATGYSPRYYDQVVTGDANIDAPGHYGKLVTIFGGLSVAEWRAHDEAWVNPRL